MRITGKLSEVFGPHCGLLVVACLAIGLPSPLVSAELPDGADTSAVDAGPEFGVPSLTRASPADFRVEPWMRPTVDFWKRIYTEYTSAQGLIHDSKYPGLIYEIVDARHLDEEGRRDLIQRSKDKWNAILRSIHAKQFRIHSLSTEELRVFKLFSKIDEQDKFLKASEKNRIRFQLGLKDRFSAAIVRSGRYIKEMEKIFEEHGVPGELTRLPFVESSFELFAYSRSSAAGIWQFIPSTGRRYLRVDPIVDERFDPLRATRAAAELLKVNFESLKTWPLAVTAYNHGRGGIQKVVEKMGTTDFQTLVERYRGPSFGIASRNYYLSFLAALEVERSHEHYFGKLTKDGAEELVEVRLMDYVPIKALSDGLQLSESRLRELNPTFGQAILEGRRRIPAGYPLRVPESWGKGVGGARAAFWLGYSRIPSSLRYKDQLRGKL